MPKRKKAAQPGKMSEIMKELVDRLFRDPDVAHSSEALHVTSILRQPGLERVHRPRCSNGRKPQTSGRPSKPATPDLWDELKSRDIDAMIDELVEYKKAHFPDDRRRILTCGGTDRSTIRVEWLPPAAPGVDAKRETTLYGLVRMGMEEEAVRLLQENPKMSTVEARMQVAKMAADLGII